MTNKENLRAAFQKLHDGFPPESNQAMLCRRVLDDDAFMNDMMALFIAVCVLVPELNGVIQETQNKMLADVMKILREKHNEQD